MKVKVLQNFRDRENDLKFRKKDSIFDTAKARAEMLTRLGYVEIVQDEKKGDPHDIS